VQQAILEIVGGVGFVLVGVVSAGLLLLLPPTARDTSMSVTFLAPLAVGYSTIVLAWFRLVARRFAGTRSDAEAAHWWAGRDWSASWLLPLMGLIVTAALVALNSADIVNWPASDAFERSQQVAVLAIPWLPWAAPTATALISLIELASLRYLSRAAISFTADPILNARAERTWKLRARSTILLGGMYIGILAIAQPGLLHSYQAFDILILGLGMLCVFVHVARVIVSQPELARRTLLWRPAR
jgi:hypothetical protein